VLLTILDLTEANMYIDRKVPYSIREHGKDKQYRRKETSPRNKS